MVDKSTEKGEPLDERKMTQQTEQNEQIQKECSKIQVQKPKSLLTKNSLVLGKTRERQLHDQVE